LFNLIYNE
jgi:translation initiation factor 3 subunit I